MTTRPNLFIRLLSFSQIVLLRIAYPLAIRFPGVTLSLCSAGVSLRGFPAGCAVGAGSVKATTQKAAAIAAINSRMNNLALRFPSMNFLSMPLLQWPRVAISLSYPLRSA
jgi:hypothetical protein